MGRVAPGVGVVALFFIAENIQVFFVSLFSFVCIFALLSRASCENKCAKGRVACTAWKCVFGCAFLVKKWPFGQKKRRKSHLLQKKIGKCFVVKKKAIPLHSLYNGNSAINDDRLFSSVGQST